MFLKLTQLVFSAKRIRRKVFLDFVAGFPRFCGKSAQKHPPGKFPAKTSRISTTKLCDFNILVPVATQFTKIREVEIQNEHLKT